MGLKQYEDWYRDMFANACVVVGALGLIWGLVRAIRYLIGLIPS